MRTLTSREAEVMAATMSPAPVMHEGQAWSEMLPVLNDFIMRGYATWSWITIDGCNMPLVTVTPVGIDAYRCWQAARTASCL